MLYLNIYLISVKTNSLSLKQLKVTGDKSTILHISHSNFNKIFAENYFKFKIFEIRLSAILDNHQLKKTLITYNRFKQR